MSQAEDTNHQHPCIATGSYGDHLNHISTVQLQAENQQLRKAYQNLMQERDMLIKALNVYHIGLSFSESILERNSQMFNTQ